MIRARRWRRLVCEWFGSEVGAVFAD
ncbi:hypothetical protein KTR9_0082 [Gordonia sp. KTR9]|nr:hypothetical protein KTR9_0082 [Gordonia sp. KTR9]